MERFSILILPIIFSIPFIMGCIENSNHHDQDKIELHLEEYLLDTNITHGFANGNEWTNVDVIINFNNITEIYFNLSSSIKEKIQDEFILEINPPDGTIVNYDPSNKSNQQNNPIMIICKIQEMQTEQMIFPSDLGSYTNANGIGSWTARIFCIPKGAFWEEEWVWGDFFTLEVKIFGYRRLN